MSKVLLTRAVIFSALLMMFLTFLMHTPCRNSNYTDSQFTSFCYSDIPVQFADKNLPTDIAPIPHALMLAISKVPGDFLLHTVLFQLLIAGAFVLLAVMVSNFPAHKPTAAVTFALMPLWAFTLFISNDIFAITFATAAIYYFYKRKLNHAAVFSGFALASGSWTWVVALAIVIQLYKYATAKHIMKFAAISLGVTVILNLPRILAHQPLISFSDQYGDGTPLYIWSLMSDQGSPTGLISIWLGIGLTIFIIRWAIVSVFDFRIELLILIFVCIQVLTDTSISPQSLTHILFLLIIAFPNMGYLLKMTVPMIVYVIAVWMNYESDSGTRGINPINYAVFSVILWVVIISIGFKAADYIAVPGDDEVLASRKFEVRT
jgi:hypothetical protein